MDELVDHFFCGPRALYGPYERADPGQETLPGVLYGYTLTNTLRGLQQEQLQVFCGLGDIGGQMWEQEVRVLLRLGSGDQPALPQIRWGIYHEAEDIAFLVTDATGETLKNEDTLEELRADPLAALDQFKLLTDALDRLHVKGLMHRNLQPDAIQMVRPEGEGRFSLRLRRFEMSTFVANLLRSLGADRGGRERDLLRAYRQQILGYEIYCPPERLALLFPGEEPTDQLETDRSDVYSLGILAWRIFVGPFPDALVKKAFPKDSYDPAALKELHDELVQRIGNIGLPRDLVDLIRSMIRLEQLHRPRAGDVVHILVRHNHAIASVWEEEGPKGPLHVGFLKGEGGDVFRDCGLIDADLRDMAGEVELTKLLQTEMTGCELVYSPEGCDPYRGRARVKNPKEARYVFLGQEAAWFAALYKNTALGTTTSHILLVRYVHPRMWGRLKKLEDSPLRQTVPKVIAVPVVPNQDLARFEKHYHNWKPLLDRTFYKPRVDRWRPKWENAFGFLLDYQEMELRARAYPFVRKGWDPKKRMRLQHDTERDRAHMDSHDLLFHYDRVRKQRRPFTDFFEEYETDDYELWLDVYDASDRFDPRADRRHVRYLGYHGNDTVFVDARQVPEKGWLIPKDERGSREMWLRQRYGRDEFFITPDLGSQLNQPTTVVGFRSHWKDAGKGLEGGAPERVKDMLVSQPFYALHGPPGTGKTTVTAMALEAAVRRDRSMRVLVSAQSNFSLDNLAEKIMGRFPAGEADPPVAIRIASREERVDDAVMPYLLRRVVADTLDRIVRNCEREIRKPDRSGPVRELLQEWKLRSEHYANEISDRIRRGANIVFATSGTATRRNVDAVGNFGVYDWVIVEEAAKAWPTELAIPLVRGTRWTLVGDHVQLPAFRRREVEVFLRSCTESHNPKIRRHGESANEYVEVFDMFKTLFDRRGTFAQGQGLPEPLGELDLQFRMHEDIQEVVGRAFYPLEEQSDRPVSRVRTDPSANRAHRIREPECLRGKAVVWIDTESFPLCHDERNRSNEGEALIIAELLRRMEPFPTAGKHGFESPAIAILTPYRRQQKRLQGLHLRGDAGQHVHTIDSYQGREAEVVIASLVRSTRHDGPAYRNLGHVSDAARVNVLLSRARRLLVVVGRFRHFCDSGVPFWKVVCDAVHERGRVVRATDLFKGLS